MAYGPPSGAHEECDGGGLDSWWARLAACYCAVLYVDVAWGVAVLLLGLWAREAYLSAMLLAPALWLMARPVPDPFNAPWWVPSAAAAVTRLFCAYFPIRVVFQDTRAFEGRRGDVKMGCPGGGSGPLLVVLEPHSVMPVASMPWTAFNTYEWPQGWPSSLRFLTSSAIMKAPLSRHLFGWFGATDAGFSNASTLLARGDSLVVTPGGAREVMHMRRGRRNVLLASRRGFVRLALRHRAALVPAFAFGQDEVYHFAGPQLCGWSPWVAGLYSAWARHLGFVPVAFWGRKGTPLPLRRPMTVVVGTPIPPPDDPDDESPAALDAHHARFVTALVALFNRYKAEVQDYEADRLHVI